MSGHQPQFRAARGPLGLLRRPAVATGGGVTLLATVGLALTGAGPSAAVVGAVAPTSAVVSSIHAQAESDTAERAERLAEHRAQVAADRADAREALRLRELDSKVDAAREAALAKQKADIAAAKKALAKKKAAAVAKKRLARAQANPKAVAKELLGKYGFGAGEFSCLEQLWVGESNWNYRAANASSGAYGIPQSLPGSKMASVANDWKTNPETQIRWGLGYIKATYGTPCGALASWNSRSPHWY